MHDRRRAHFTGIMTKSGLSPADTQANLPGKLLIRQRDHKKKNYFITLPYFSPICVYFLQKSFQMYATITFSKTFVQ